MSEIDELAQVIERLHGCKARHLRSELVREIFRGKTVWDGVVEVFTVTGHANARQCYAWKHWEDDMGLRERIVAVLGLPPVDSAVTAVRAAIVADVKRNRAN